MANCFRENILFFKEKHSFEKITIFEDFLLTFKIGNGRDVKNYFPEEISHDLWQPNY